MYYLLTPDLAGGDNEGHLTSPAAVVIVAGVAAASWLFSFDASCSFFMPFAASLATTDGSCSCPLLVVVSLHAVMAGDGGIDGRRCIVLGRARDGVDTATAGDGRGGEAVAHDSEGTMVTAGDGEDLSGIWRQ